VDDTELLRSLWGLGGAPVVVALVELVKRTVPSLEARWYPLVALACGVALNLALAYLLGNRYDVAVLIGVLASLIASGLWSGTKAAVVEPVQDARAEAAIRTLHPRG
jgi:hypothetical protein